MLLSHCTFIRFIYSAFVVCCLFPGCKATGQLKNPVNASSSVIHIKDYNADATGKKNSTKAFQQAAAWLQQNGGTLIIDPGTYTVGEQKLSGSYLAGFSYSAEPILNFRNVSKPIFISGYGATLKAQDGLKYGSFDPVTGLKDHLRKKGNNSSYYASAYIFINAESCATVSVKGLTLDGNSGNLAIGPAFSEDGIQLMATGIRVYNNKNINIEDCNIHHCALDAIIVAWTGLKESDPIYPHTIKNVKATFNGRQGLSWVGGNNLTVTASEFSSTGKAMNNNIPVVSKPSAGIDIEIENSIIKNGRFINCNVFNNAGPGIISIGHETHNIQFLKCSFIGTTNSAAYPKSQEFSFDSCTFVGKVERIFGSKDKRKAISFKNCLFTMDPKKSPNKTVYGEYSEFYEGENVIFENCEFNAANKQLPVFNNKEIIFSNCSFYQSGNFPFKASAIFKGVNKIKILKPGAVDASEAKFEGDVFYNDRKIQEKYHAN